MNDYPEFQKIARLAREIVVTEKIDGTNALIHIENGLITGIGSRTRWITMQDDNYGFTKWVMTNQDDLLTLGDGLHYGEWWGQGIQCRYGMDKKAFSLFNSKRWQHERPECCDVVPILYEGMFSEEAIEKALFGLKDSGSVAAKKYGVEFMKPEGVIIYHTAARIYLKKTIEKDQEWKGKTDKK